MQKKDDADSDEDEARKDSVIAAPAPRHRALLTLPFVRVGRRSGRRRDRRGRSCHGCSGRGVVAFGRGEGGRQIDQSKDDKNDRPGVPKLEEAAAKLRKQKKHTDSNDENRSCESAEGAALAVASSPIAHFRLTFRAPLSASQKLPESKHRQECPSTLRASLCYCLRSMRLRNIKMPTPIKIAGKKNCER